jgi:hypothetical protein
MGQCAEKRLLTAPKRSACPCAETYPFLAATLPTVRDQQFIGILAFWLARRSGEPGVSSEATLLSATLRQAALTSVKSTHVV